MAPRVRKKKSASSTASAAAPATGTSQSAATPTSVSTSPAAVITPLPPLVFLDLPPANANIPAPPAGFVAGDSADYRAVLPRDAELRALPIAVKDLAKFTNYAQVLGDTAPPYTQVVQAFTAANAWSSMRTESAAWDAFCGSQEGIAWTTLRSQMARLQPSFTLAASGSTNLDTLFPGLATLLEAKKVIARKGASTRKANTKAQAEGKEPLHGQVGKTRKKRAEKAAYAAATSGTPSVATQGAAVASATGAVAAPQASVAPAGTAQAVAPQASTAPGTTANGAH